MTKRKPAVVPDVGNERTLPHSLEGERSVLGAILVKNDTLDAVAARLKVDHFFRDAHRRIYAAMLDLRTTQKRAIDLVTLKADLARRGDLEACGGPSYLASLADGVPRSTNAANYAAIIEEAALRRALIVAANHVVAEAYDGYETGPAILARADRALLALRASSPTGARSLHDTALDRFQAMEWRVEHKGQLRGLGTGYPSIDDLTLGLRAGDLNIVAARPSIGKSTLAMNIAVHAATAGATVLFCSLEMTREQLEDRILAQLSRVALSRIQSGHIADPEWPAVAQAMTSMEALPIVIDDLSAQTAVEVRGLCRRAIAEHGSLGLVVVDYVQLMASALGRKGATRTEELGDAAQRLKDTAKELGVPVLLLSQLRRLDGRPRIEDLRECGTLEQVADTVALLHRKDHRVGGPTECILAKQRNGPTGTVMLSLDRDTTTFTDGGGALPEPTAEEAQADTKRRRTRTFAKRWA